MKSEWSLATLGKVATNESRRFNFHNKDKVVFINTGDVLEGRFIKSDYIDSQGLPGQAKKAIKPNDILFSEIRPANKRYAFVDFDSANYVVSTKFMVIKASVLISVKYLFLVLTSNVMLRELQQIAESRSGTFPQITFDAVSHIPIKLPPLPTQKTIAHILSTLDDKIELNRKMNLTLESMAQAVFKSWFVDFDPVHAKAGASSEDELDKAAKDLGISREVLDLFPSEFEESELGLIPKGWDAGELRNIARFSTSRIDTSELSLETYISTENMLEGKKGVTNASSLPTIKTVPRFNSGQILISNIRPYFMKIWLARFEGGRSNDVLGIDAIDSGCVEYLYNLLYQDAFFNFMMKTSKGVKMPRGDKQAIMAWICVQPTLKVKKAYSTVVESFYKSIDSLNKEKENLGFIRDTLLPKLLSGELDVSNLDLGLTDD